MTWWQRVRRRAEHAVEWEPRLEERRRIVRYLCLRCSGSAWCTKLIQSGRHWTDPYALRDEDGPAFVEGGTNGL
jgi:hypothetical protein